MATIGDTDLCLNDKDAICGAAFQLSEPAVTDLAQVHANGARVIIQRGRKYAIALFPKLQRGDALVAAAYQQVQQMLDVLSIEGNGNLAIPGGIDGDIVWWRHKGQVHLRVYVVATRTFSVSISGTVHDPDGNAIPSPPLPSTSWRPAFRYFRLSQTSDDLYEAYRNMYLAFESVASSMYPKANSENEADWLKRVTRALGQQLGAYVRPGAVDAPGAFFQEQHKANRCALFHAKGQQHPLLPGELSNRKQVAQAYERLAGLVLQLCQQHLHVRRHSGYITAGGVRLMMDSLAQKFVIAVSSEADLPDTSLNALINARRLTNLKTAYLGMVDSVGFVHAFRGSCEAKDLASSTVRSVASHEGPDTGFLSSGTIDDLHLEGVDIFEVNHTFAFINRASPRVRFAL